ncbi:hypothetical protein D3C84_788810 [compost metagenome]
MDDVAAHLCEYRLQRSEQFRGGADHEGQRPGRRTTRATGNRCIGHGHTLFGSGSRHIACSLRIDGAAIHGRHAFADTREHTVLTQPHAAYMHRSRQHGDHQFRAFCRFPGRRADAAAQLFKLCQHGFVQVDHTQCVASLDQVACHWRAHVAETDKSDFHVRLLNAN